jgi:hypothetical protein
LAVSKSHHAPAKATTLLTQAVVGIKPLEDGAKTADMLIWLVMLFCLEKEGCPAGILPRAFSDIPRSCNGTLSSTADEIDGLREV